MEPSLALRRAVNLAFLHDLKGWKIRLSSRLRTCYGYCSDDKQIVLSEMFCKYNTPDLVEDCILHEIAHALAGVHNGHKEEWKKVALRIGAKPSTRCHDPNVVMPAHYKANCPKCQQEYFRFRKPHSEYHCPRCGKVDGSLIWQGSPNARNGITGRFE